MASDADRAALLRLRTWLTSGRLPASLADDEAAALAAVAERQGLAPLLDDAVAAAEPRWKPLVADDLRRAHRASLAASLRRLDVAARVLGRLAAAGVPALPLKGCAVAEDLYDSPAHRPMGDVDVLVLGDWRAARDALAGEGYAAADQADHALGLRDPQTGEVVELHHSVTACPGLFPIDVEAVWRRRRAGAGLVPWLPDPLDRLLMLALHAVFQHGLVLRLGQYLDFRRALERDAVDAAELVARAREARAIACVGIALAVAQRLVGAPVPEALAGLAAAAGQRALVAAAATPEAWRGGEPASLARVRWTVSAGQRLRLLAATLAPPPPAPDPASSLRRWLAAPRRALALGARMLGRYRPGPGH